MSGALRLTPRYAPTPTEVAGISVLGAWRQQCRGGRDVLRGEQGDSVAGMEGERQRS